MAKAASTTKRSKPSARKPGKAKTAPRTRAKTSARAKATRARAKTTRAAPVRKPVRSAAPRRPARAPQKFVASHPSEDAFLMGLRTYAKYRDLGIKDASGGLVQAHVIRLLPPCRPEEVSKLHFHDVEFQMIYVLKGWMRSEFEGEGAHTFHAGACWMQPPKIKHKVLGYSDDCEVLEIILPADFDTVELE